MIYADNNGSVPLLDCVKIYLHKRIDSNLFANPNALHNLGTKIMIGMEKCRTQIANLVGADTNQIIFNSGATEAITSIFHSVLIPKNKKIIVTSAIEHAAVLQSAEYFKKYFNYEIYYIPTNTDGTLDISAFEKFVASNAHDIAIVSVMYANNETGIINPIHKISQITNTHQIPFFCDTTQVIGKLPFNFNETLIDFAVCSSHKLGALPGAGFILVKNPTNFHPLIVGGGQEKNKRSGTQNYLAIETMYIALEDATKHLNENSKLTELKLQFESELKNKIPNVIIFGENSNRLPGTTLLAFPGLHGQGIQIELEAQNIFVTTSSACSDNDPSTSKVLKAMNVEDNIGRGVIRISLTNTNAESQYKQLFEALKNAYQTLSRITNF
jgi:cysteine desulfurase